MNKAKWFVARLGYRQLWKHGSQTGDVVAAAFLALATRRVRCSCSISTNQSHLVFRATPRSQTKWLQLEVVLSRVRAHRQIALCDAVAVALEHLKNSNRDKKVLIVISDAGGNRPHA